ncbi:unnamed protein product, partial [Oppiella nova]
MLVLVVVVFAVCWLCLLKSWITEQMISKKALSYNPFIYCWLNSTFRTGAKKFFSYLMRCDLRPVVSISDERRRSSINDNETRLDTVVTTATTTLNNKKLSIMSLQESPDNISANAVNVDVEHDVYN